MTITYNDSLLLDYDVVIDAGFTSVLDNFTAESGFVQSSAELTLQRDVNMDGTRLECSIADLASDEIDVLFNNGNNLPFIDLHDHAPSLQIGDTIITGPAFCPL